MKPDSRAYRRGVGPAGRHQIRVARQAETLGYHSLWVFQRLLYALDSKNEYPPVPGKTWPKPFERVLDPSSRSPMCRGHLAHPPRHERADHAVLHPVVLAKQLATLDVLFGEAARRRAGPRWSEAEYEAVGVPTSARAARRRSSSLPRP